VQESGIQTCVFVVHCGKHVCVMSTHVCVIPPPPRACGKVIAEVCRLARDDAVVSTNTMTLSVTDIARGCDCPERVIGVRFLYPVLLITDVEMTVGSDTSNTTIEQVKSMLIQDRKKPYMKRPGSGNHLVRGCVHVHASCVHVCVHVCVFVCV
jgi:hypothetical protein